MTRKGKTPVEAPKTQGTKRTRALAQKHKHKKKKRIPEPEDPGGWVKGCRTLMDHPQEMRAEIFKAKNTGSALTEKKVKRSEFEKFGMNKCFDRMGWGGVLDVEPDGVYEGAVKEWMSTLKRNVSGRKTSVQLVGKVNGVEYAMNLEIIRSLLNVDTGMEKDSLENKETNYECVTDETLGGQGLEHTDVWYHRIATVFDIAEDEAPTYTAFMRAHLRPLAKVLFRVLVTNIFPRPGDQASVRCRDVTVLYALMTGVLPISYAFIVMSNIWLAYDRKDRKNYPHAYAISKVLKHLGAIPEDIPPTVAGFQYIRKASVKGLHFLKSDQGFIIKDKATGHEHVQPFSEEERQQWENRMAGDNPRYYIEQGRRVMNSLNTEQPVDGSTDYDKLLNVVTELSGVARDAWKKQAEQLAYIQEELRWQRGELVEIRAMIEDARPGIHGTRN